MKVAKPTIVKDLLFASHFGTVFLSGLIILFSETVQEAQISVLGIVAAILITYRTYTLSDWVIALLN